MKLRPFTKEEQRFAEKNHDLVYAFLNEKKLSESDFYDIVVFGYLGAVQEYCSKSGLHRYKFSTLAWRRMRNILSDYYRYMSSPKRNARILSLDVAVEQENGLSASDAAIYNDVMHELRVDFLMHELSRKLPPREMRIVKMKVNGEKMHAIAKSEKLTFQEINRLLCNIYPSVREIFYG